MRWIHARRLVQTLALAGFVLLLLGTREPLRETVPVEIFIRIDPLLGAVAMLASRTLIAAMLPGLAIVALTLILGRAFCGWLCPLGTTIDVFDRLVRRKHGRGAPQPRLAQGKYVTLTLSLVLAAFGFSIAGWIDPLSLATRFYGGVILPLLAGAGSFLLEGLDLLGATDAADALAAWFERVGLAPRPGGVGAIPVWDVALVTVVLGLSLFRKRFWCRSLCPLGGGLALLSRFRLFGPVSSSSCRTCPRCESACPTGALRASPEPSQGGRRISDPGECVQCFSCLPVCREGAMVPGRVGREPEAGEIVPSRRAFLASAAAGAATLPLIGYDPGRAHARDEFLIRPPGAQDEGRFLDLCVRCGQCSRACPTGGLRPSGLSGGIEGLLTPRLVPRIVTGAGYCDYECSLCGRVCPTGAIPELSLPDKKAVLMGIAVFDEARCLPFATGEECVVCEEHCPTPEKAIRTRSETVTLESGEERTVLTPRVIDDRCVGCAICEAVCPVPGPSAIRVKRRE